MNNIIFVDPSKRSTGIFWYDRFGKPHWEHMPIEEVYGFMMSIFHPIEDKEPLIGGDTKPKLVIENPVNTFNNYNTAWVLGNVYGLITQICFEFFVELIPVFVKQLQNWKKAQFDKNDKEIFKLKKDGSCGKLLLDTKKAALIIVQKEYPEIDNHDIADAYCLSKYWEENDYMVCTGHAFHSPEDKHKLIK